METTVEKLLKFSRLDHFEKGKTIFYEGQTDPRMYVVASGTAGLYLRNFAEDFVKVQTVQTGGFLGEMALFDGGKRVGTCIAEEDTACVPIDRKNLRRLIGECPELAEGLMIKLSENTRQIGGQLERIMQGKPAARFRPFALPEGHHEHEVERREGFSRYLESGRATCPVCGHQITVFHVKRQDLPCACILDNQRRLYQDFNILWHYIWDCPECGYTNYYDRFFYDYRLPRGELLRVINDQSLYMKKVFRPKSVFDKMAFQYFQAIHLNECLNSEDLVLLGRLWLYLGWLYEDAKDEQMQFYCHERALKYYRTAYEQNSPQLQNDDGRQYCATVMAELCAEMGNYTEARNYFYEVVRYPGKELMQTAYDRLFRLRTITG